MAASITFDFISRGAGQLAGDFRKTGDSAAAASRGAKVLQDVIKSLGEKENRTAAESKLLASALRQTGVEEDRAAAKALAADIAIRRMSDAMKDSSKSTSTAQGEVGKLAKALDGLKGKGGPALLGPALLLAPAITTLAGVAAGAAAGLGGAFIAGAGSLAAFGAVAKPVLADAKTAATAVGKAQDAYNAAIASGTPKAKAYKAEQAAIAKAYGDMSPAQIALSRQLGAMAEAWDAVKKAETPVVAGAMAPWLKSVTDLTRNLPPVIAKIAPVIAGLGRQFDTLIGSSAFKGFRDFIGSTGAAAVSAGGSTIIDLVKSFMILLPKFDPLIREAIGWISRLGPAVLAWSSSKKASDDIQKFLQWFSQNGPAVTRFIQSVGGALKALAPGLVSGGALELKVITAFLGFVAKLPPSVAKPIAEVAAVLLTLNKLGVFPVGVKIVGAAAGWVKKLLGGAAVDLGAAGMQKAGDTMLAAAGEMNLAARTMAGAGVAGGAGGAAGAAEKAAGGGLLTTGTAGLGALITGPLIGAAAGVALALYLQKYHAQDKPPPAAQTGPRGFQPPPSQAWKTYDGLVTAAAAATTAAAAAADRATARIRADFTAQGKAAAAAQADVGVLTASITRNGNASGEAHAARATLQADMIKAGVNAATAQADVVRYSNAVTANGATSDQARAARQRLVTDILNASANSRKGNTDLSAFTTAVQQHGVKSDAARSARQRLITDLINSGTDARTATGLVNGLGTAVKNLPAGKTITLQMIASGTGGVKVTATQQGIAAKEIMLSKLAAGGIVRLGTGPTADDVPAMLSRGELVVPARMVAAGAVDHLRGRLPGFAAGGIANMGRQSGALPPAVNTAFAADAQTITAADLSAIMKAMQQQIAQAQATAAAGLGNLPLGKGPLSGSAAVAQAFAKSILYAYGWTQAQFPYLQALWNQESGWNAYAVNPSSGAYGIPQSLGHGHPYNLGDYQAQIRWGLAYISQRYGSPAAAWAHERAYNWYGAGGMVPGMAAGGTVAQQGRTFLNAWQTRHGGPYALATGPRTLNQQIPPMAAAAGRARTLASAPGLSPGQHRFWANAAASETRLLATLHKELSTEQAWKYQLGLSELTLDREIKAAGNLPGLAGPVRGWKAQLAADKRTAAAISGMIGLTAGQQAAAAKKAAPAPAGPKVIHTYGGDVTNTIGAVLSAALGPFTGARAGGLIMDSGGILRPGFNPVWNNTGRPEQLVPARSGGAGRLQVEWVGGNGGDDLEKWIRKNIKIRGGGDVQRAWGSR